MEDPLTQNYVADIVNVDENVTVLLPRVYVAFQYQETGYIVIEYIPGSDCSQDDSDAIAVAIERLNHLDQSEVG